MLNIEQFTEIGCNGVGNPRSQVAQSMCFHRGCLYLGVTHPKGEGPNDAARILRYDPGKQQWETLYQSPLTQPDENAVVHDVYRGAMNASRKLGRLESDTTLVPLYRGFRCMAEYQGRQDPEPMLFASTLSHWGSQLLCSRNGRDFAVASEPGLGNDDVLSFRALFTYDHKLFVAPAGIVRSGVMDRMFGDIAMLYVSEDPLSGEFHEAILPGFDDPENKSIFAMAEFNGYLYVGTGNPNRGFQVWKTKAEGQPPYQWTRVLTEGAYRYNFNECTTTMAVLNGALYVGSGIPGLGYDKSNDVGPAAAELIRLWPDDSWDLIMGVPRFTPDGLKVPLSLQGPGYGDPDNSALWSMTVYDNVLYVGTHHCGSFHRGLAGSAEIVGGFQLWASPDGENWEAITLDGFGDPFATGVRNLMPSPAGLFLGTSTHREIEKFWQRRSGRRRNDANPGGLSIWLGK